jgi:hypothetical protein
MPGTSSPQLRKAGACQLALSPFVTKALSLA